MKDKQIDQNYTNEEHYELSREYHVHYQRAISLNNTGVFHFESGNYDEARVLFRDALKALRQSTIAAASCSTYCEEQEHEINDDKIPEFIIMTDDSSSIDSNERFRIRLKWSKCAPLHSELLLNIMPQEAAATTQENIFSRALFLVDINSQNNQLATILYQEDMGANESKGIIYNIALSYLYLSLENGSMGLLKKARHLFSKIIQLQTSPATTSSDKFEGSYDDCEFYPIGNESFSDSFSKGTADTVPSSEEFGIGTSSNAVVCDDKFWSNFRFPKASYSEIFNRMEKIVRPKTKVPSTSKRRCSKHHELFLTLS